MASKPFLISPQVDTHQPMRRRRQLQCHSRLHVRQLPLRKQEFTISTSRDLVQPRSMRYEAISPPIRTKPLPLAFE
jgi:hypothetical protein